jgi:hypothetical protein
MDLAYFITVLRQLLMYSWIVHTPAISKTFSVDGYVHFSSSILSYVLARNVPGTAAMKHCDCFSIARVSTHRVHNSFIKQCHCFRDCPILRQNLIGPSPFNPCFP